MQATERRQEEATASKALSHPVAVRILEIANERPMSPVRFLKEGLLPPGTGEGKTDPAKMSLVGYHFRALEKAGCIELIETHPRRGAVEHVYRGRAVAYFSDAKWAELDAERRRAISRAMFQGMVARVESAMFADTFDARLDRMLVWGPLELDKQGWRDLTATMARCFGEIEQIRHDSRKRLDDSEETPIPGTYGMVGFESPGPVRLPPR
jgi:hypothetical protein